MRQSETFGDEMRAVTEALPVIEGRRAIVELKGHHGAQATVIYKAENRAEACQLLAHLPPQDLYFVECGDRIKYIWSEYYLRSNGPGVENVTKSIAIASFVFRVDQGLFFGPNAKLEWYCLLKPDLLVRVEVDLGHDKAGFTVNEKEQHWPNEGFPQGLRIGYWGAIDSENAYLTVYWPLDRVQWPEGESIVGLGQILLGVK